MGRALRAGRLTFELLGKKLKGIWSLIRKLSGPNAMQKEWFLRKEHDAEAKLLSEMDVLMEYPLSVVTNRPLEEIAKDPPLFPVKSRVDSKSKNVNPNQQSLFQDFEDDPPANA